MQVSQGILTVRGGMTSHAAVVARGMGTCCVSGCGNDNKVAIDYDAKTISINDHVFHECDWMSIDGSTGNIYEGQIATVASTENANFQRFMAWADAARQMKVLTNADNPRDAQNAVDMGAEGIGLCRTEHMFFAEDRIKAVREMICARTGEERKTALAKVEPYQEADFTAMYRIMGDRPMTCLLYTSTVLAVSQQAAGAPDLQVTHGNAEAGPERGEFPDGRTAFGGDFGQNRIPPEGEVGIRLAGGTAHPAADLVQLGKAHAVGILDDQGVAVAHVHTGFDAGGTDQDVDLVVQQLAPPHRDCLLYTSRCV